MGGVRGRGLWTARLSRASLIWVRRRGEGKRRGMGRGGVERCRGDGGGSAHNGVNGREEAGEMSFRVSKQCPQAIDKKSINLQNRGSEHTSLQPITSSSPNPIPRHSAMSLSAWSWALLVV